MTSAAPCSAIQTRRVFYIPGFDPMPARAYRERYRRQSRIQAAHSGHVIAISPRRAEDDFGWRVTATIAEQKVVTDVTVLIWADIVRSSMQLGILATYRALLATAWTYLASGALFRLMRLRKGPIIAALYPVIVLIVQAVLASGLGYGTYHATLALGGLLGDWGRFGALLTGAASAMGAVVWLTFLRWCQRRDHLLAWYLMHDYAFSAQAKGAYPPAQEARMVAFAEVIAAALATDTDEVLIVGHSSGAILAISVLADLVRTGRVPSEGPHLSLLTLGHVVPMVSFLPEAHRLRADLAYLSASPTLAWVDVTAPGDGCSFALCDPVAVSGVAPPINAGRWSFRPPIPEPCAPRHGPRCAGGFSRRIFNISTPSISCPGGSRITTTSPSPPVPCRWARGSLRAPPHPVASPRRSTAFRACANDCARPAPQAAIAA